MTYRSEAPSHRGGGPPRGLRQRVREIYFHCAEPCQEIFDAKRPPKRPIELHEFPNLVTFRICRTFAVDVGRLSKLSMSDQALSPELYERLLPKDRIDLWQSSGAIPVGEFIQETGEFGRGGWLSRLVDPQRINEPIRLDLILTTNTMTRSGENGVRTYPGHLISLIKTVSLKKKKGRREEGEEEQHTRETTQKMAQKAEDELRRCREVVAQMQTLLDIELNVFCVKEESQYIAVTGEPVFRKWIDKLLVAIDTRTKKVVELRILDQEEAEEREEWSAPAS